MAEALDNIARQAINVSETLVGADKRRFLTQARKDFVDAATKLYGSERAAEKLADKLFGLDKIKVKPDIDVDTGPAQAGIRAIESWLNNIDDEHVKVYVERVGTMGGNEPLADGGTIPGRRTPYGDKGLYMLAPGEEVISNRRGQADRHRALLKRINAGGLAEGGTYTSRRGQNGWASTGSQTMPPGWTAMQDAAAGVGWSLKTLKKRLEEAEKALARETSQRDAVIGKMDDLRSSITSGLTSGSLFEVSEASANPWAAGATAGGVMDPFAAQAARKDRAKRMLAAIATLKEKHVTGAALQEILAEGLEAAEFMASQSESALGGFVSDYAETASLINQAGTAGANAAFGPEFREATKEWKEANRRLDRIEKAVKEADRNNTQGQKDNAKAVADGVNGAAAGGKSNQVYANQGRPAGWR
jgi:hypothetical protein